MTPTATTTPEATYRDAFPAELVDELWLTQRELLQAATLLVLDLEELDDFGISMTERQLNLCAQAIGCPPRWAVYDDPQRPGHPLVGYPLSEGVLGFIPDEIAEAGNADEQAIELGRRLSEMAFMAAADRRPITRERIGRNEPCPCASGAKFKRCCGR